MTFDLVYEMIVLLSSWWFTVSASLAVGAVVFVSAYLLLKISSVPLRWGIVAGLLALLILSIINYLLNVPLGPSLTSQALPPDYVSLWVKVALVFGSIQVAQLLMLVALYFKKR